MELAKIRSGKKWVWLRLHVGVLAATVTTLAFSGVSFGATSKQKSFASAEEAVKAIVAAAKNQDDKELLAIFGPAARELIFSGDAIADRQRRERFVQAYNEKNSLLGKGDSAVLVIGKKDWPFPIPVVKKGKGWVFDTAKGKEEILNRRIGENELNAIQVCLAIVDAQREYAMKDPDYNETLAYAEKFMSDPGKTNGLYWETKDGEKPSPLGPLVAQARQEGYGKNRSGDKTSPYHGYYYRILKAQGKNAPGGAYNYLVKGKMIGGFALVAYPAEYGNSGVMTFIVNHDGVVYQRDLGKGTANLAQKMSRFDPDRNWKKIDNVAKF